MDEDWENWPYLSLHKRISVVGVLINQKSGLGECGMLQMWVGEVYISTFRLWYPVAAVFFKEVYQRLIWFTQSKAILSVDVKWMQLQFIGLPDESVHVTRHVGQKFGVLKFGFVIQINAVFCYCWFVGLAQFYMPTMFLDAMLKSTTALSNIY